MTGIEGALAEAIGAIVEILRGYGLPGAAILWLGMVNWRQSRRIDELTDRALERETTITEKLTEMLVLLRARAGQ